MYPKVSAFTLSEQSRRGRRLEHAGSPGTGARGGEADSLCKSSVCFRRSRNGDGFDPAHRVTWQAHQVSVLMCDEAPGPGCERVWKEQETPSREDTMLGLFRTKRAPVRPKYSAHTDWTPTAERVYFSSFLPEVGAAPLGSDQDIYLDALQSEHQREGWNPTAEFPARSPGPDGKSGGVTTATAGARPSRACTEPTALVCQAVGHPKPPPPLGATLFLPFDSCGLCFSVPSQCAGQATGAVKSLHVAQGVGCPHSLVAEPRGCCGHELGTECRARAGGGGGVLWARCACFLA
ncbi:uncharacterized protein LOC125146793 isoform X1 [Prionailurus viverrinus]|uniref:uncharacterized protein LOC125146793 isoform X1 n=1 Tax=Prionailurus viverrinus TaxID=61388 RepID=UPI001FF39C45|nr:uncharacterized protein LOC125146793 isoform X1 [Prionailurus viverrinus]